MKLPSFLPFPSNRFASLCLQSSLSAGFTVAPCTWDPTLSHLWFPMVSLLCIFSFDKSIYISICFSFLHQKQEVDFILDFYNLPTFLLHFIGKHTKMFLCSLFLPHHISFVLPHPPSGFCLLHSTKMTLDEVNSDLCWDKSVTIQCSAPQFPSVTYAPNPVGPNILVTPSLPPFLDITYVFQPKL